MDGVEQGSVCFCTCCTEHILFMFWGMVLYKQIMPSIWWLLLEFIGGLVHHLVSSRGNLGLELSRALVGGCSLAYRYSIAFLSHYYEGLWK